MDNEKKARRYERIIVQLSELLTKTNNPLSRMATIIAVLHNKMDNFSWTGYYHLIEGELFSWSLSRTFSMSKNFKNNKGVCWSSINKKETIVVENVHDFEGHIACDSRSNSEIVVPILNKEGEILACLDIDSMELNNFNEVDAKYLGDIVKMIYI